MYDTLSKKPFSKPQYTLSHVNQRQGSVLHIFLVSDLTSAPFTRTQHLYSSSGPRFLYFTHVQYRANDQCDYR